MWPASTIAWSLNKKTSTNASNSTVTAAKASSIISTRSTYPPPPSPLANTKNWATLSPRLRSQAAAQSHPHAAQLTCKGRLGERPIQITKGVTLEAGGQNLRIAYVIEGLPPGELVHFGVEFNFSGLPGGCDDRYFHDGTATRSASSAPVSTSKTWTTSAFPTNG